MKKIILALFLLLNIIVPKTFADIVIKGSNLKGTNVSNFKATDISNCELWLDASDESTITLNASNVSQWDDKSGSSNNFTQSTGSRQPEYITTALNGLNAVKFDGATENMIAGSNYVFSSSDGLTMFAVVQTDNDASVSGISNAVFDFGFQGGDNYALWLATDYVAMNTSGNFGGVFTTITKTFSESPHTLVGEIVFGDTQYIYVDDVLEGSSSITLAKLTAVEIAEAPTRGAGSGPMTLGMQSKTLNESTRRFIGHIAEFIIYTRVLTTEERDRVEGYLNDKWIFKPTDITGCELWLDASDASTIILNGSDVSQWNDKSIEGHSAIQATPADQPAFVSSGLNSFPTIRFPHSGSGKGMTISGGLSIGANVDRTIFLVVNPAAGFLNNEVFGAGTGQMLDFGTNFVNNRLQVRNSSSIISNVNSVTFGSPHIIIVNDAASGNMNAWNDGVLIISNQTRHFNWNMAVDLGVGWALFDGREYNGDISEIIVYNKKLDNTERVRVETYLNDKWVVF